MPVKQVIVMRTDLGMRKGKMIAQGCHASLEAYRMCLEHEMLCRGQQRQKCLRHNPFYEWDDPRSGYRKIVVCVNSQEELMDIHNAASAAHLTIALVKDLGLTELESGTLTCLCIGPHYDEQIDPFTKHLKLL